MGIIKTIIVGGEGLTEKQEKIRKLFMYLVSGCLTTAVNWVCYVAFDKLVKADMAVNLFGKEMSPLPFLSHISLTGSRYSDPREA